MLRGVDHLVILVSELESAIASYREQGFTVVPGGHHPTKTHNALIGFADGSYLELLAFYEPNPQSKWWPRLAQGGGLIAVCMQTDDLRGEIAAFRRAGIGMTDPMPLSRTRPDGYHLKWVLSLHEGDQRDVVPFLIEDETPRDERVPKEREHSNQVTGIGTVTFAVQDVQEARRWYSQALGRDGRGIDVEDLGAGGVRFTVGGHDLDFVAPKRPMGKLHEWLQARGPSPFSVVLKTKSGSLVHPVITPTKPPENLRSAR